MQLVYRSGACNYLLQVIWAMLYFYDAQEGYASEPDPTSGLDLGLDVAASFAWLPKHAAAPLDPRQCSAPDPASLP